MYFGSTKKFIHHVFIINNKCNNIITFSFSSKGNDSSSFHINRTGSEISPSIFCQIQCL